MFKGVVIVNIIFVMVYCGSGGLIDYSVIKGVIVFFICSFLVNFVLCGIWVNVVVFGFIWILFIFVSFLLDYVVVYGLEIFFGWVG